MRLLLFSVGEKCGFYLRKYGICTVIFSDYIHEEVEDKIEYARQSAN